MCFINLLLGKYDDPYRMWDFTSEKFAVLTAAIPAFYSSDNIYACAKFVAQLNFLSRIKPRNVV